MEHEDIIQMAREAGFHTKCFVKDEVLLVAKHSNGSWVGLNEELERFAQLVAAEVKEAMTEQNMDDIWQAIKIEREACAQICDKYPHGNGLTERQLAQRIRTRSEATLRGQQT